MTTPLFYPHNVEEQRRISDELKEKANDPKNLGELAVLRLEHIALNGLPDCYTSFHEFLFDFFPNMSWTPEEVVTDLTYVLKHHNSILIFPIINKMYDVDMKSILKQSIKDAIDEI